MIFLFIQCVITIILYVYHYKSTELISSYYYVIVHNNNPWLTQKGKYKGNQDLLPVCLQCVQKDALLNHNHNIITLYTFMHIRM